MAYRFRTWRTTPFTAAKRPNDPSARPAALKNCAAQNLPPWKFMDAPTVFSAHSISPTPPTPPTRQAAHSRAAHPARRISESAADGHSRRGRAPDGLRRISAFHLANAANAPGRSFPDSASRAPDFRKRSRRPFPTRSRAGQAEPRKSPADHSLPAAKRRPAPSKKRQTAHQNRSPIHRTKRKGRYHP